MLFTGCSSGFDQLQVIDWPKRHKWSPFQLANKVVPNGEVLRFSTCLGYCTLLRDGKPLLQPTGTINQNFNRPPIVVYLICSPSLEHD